MSVTDTNKLRARVATLDKLLDDFDGQLDDLLAQSLPDTLLGLETLQQAKLQVTIPYLVYDLVIIYLKTKGIDPRSHPVFRELERVRGYIEKVSKAEKQESEQQRMAVDKAVANRFIKHAISQAVRSQGHPSVGSTGQGPTPGPSKTPVQPAPAGATSKMLARAEWEKQVRTAAEEEEEDLEVFEETERNADADADVMMGDKVPASTSLPVETGETAPQRPATTKQKKKRSRKPKLPLTGARFTPTTGDTATESADFTTDPSVHTPQLKVHATTDGTPENPSTEGNNKKRPFPPTETPTGDFEDPASGSVPKNKKRKGNEKKQNAQTTAGETGGTNSESRSQSRDVSVAPTPQVLTQPLPSAETDATTSVDEKPKRRNYNRKKGGDGQPAEPGTQS